MGNWLYLYFEVWMTDMIFTHPNFEKKDWTLFIVIVYDFSIVSQTCQMISCRVQLLIKSFNLKNYIHVSI